MSDDVRNWSDEWDIAFLTEKCATRWDDRLIDHRTHIDMWDATREPLSFINDMCDYLVDILLEL